MNKIYEPIAIIGSSCSLPGEVHHLNELWHNLSTLYDAIVDIPSKRCLQENIYTNSPQTGKSYTKKAGLINNIDSFDAKFFGITDEEAKAMDPQQRLLLEASWHALEDSYQLTNDTLLKNTGLIIGISTDDYAHIGMPNYDLNKVNTYSMLGNLRSISVGRVAYHLGLNGPVSQIDTACSSSLMAIHQACQSLRLYEADCMLAGGINLLISPQTMVALSQIKALSLSNRCSVFDSCADGYVRGEGYGLLVLKRLSDAKANNDNIIAVIKGSFSNHDGMSNGLTAPNGLIQEKLLQKTLKISNITSNEINYIECHGTGTLFGDPIEVNSIINVYGKNRLENNPLFLGSIKSSIGHLEAAAGVAGVLKVCSFISNKKLAPNLNFSTLNPYIKFNKAPIHIVDTLQSWVPSNKLRTAAVSSFGFSGTNVHMIIQEYSNIHQKLVSNKLSDKLYLVPLSAKSLVSLKSLVKAWIDADYLASEPIANIAFSAITARKHFEYKLLVLAKNYKDLSSKLKSWYEDKETQLLYSSINFIPISNKNHINKNYINSINNYFINGSISWKEIYGNEKVFYCKLPLYTFENKSYWWDETYNFIEKNTIVENEKVSYKLQWEKYTLDKSVSINHNIQVITDNKNSKISKLLENFFDDSTSKSISVEDFFYKNISENTNYIYIIDMKIDMNMLEHNLYKVWSVVQYFNKNNKTSKIWIITKNFSCIHKDISININASLIWGLFRSLRLELGNLWGGIIDVSHNINNNTINNNTINKNTINKMLMCLYQENKEDQYVLSNQEVYVPRLLPYKVDTKKTFSFNTKASYLITGGLGALGMQLVDYLISIGLKHIIIASRRTENSLNKQILHKINNWRIQGKQIDIYSLDFTQEIQVEQFFKKLKKQNINLKGIFHLSGIISKQELKNKLNKDDIQNFIGAKVKGSWYLHKYTQTFPLDFFVLFSSVTALFGMKGLSFYSASNTFLDSLAFYRNQQGLKTLSINWGRFDISGMVDKEDSLVLDSLGVAKLNTQKAFSQMIYYLEQTTNITIVDINWDCFTSYFKQWGSISLFNNILLNKTDTLIKTKLIEKKEEFKQYFIDIICDILKLDKNKISTTQNLFSMGLNSMLSMYIRQTLEQKLELKTEPTLFFKNQTIELLVGHLWEKYQNNIFKDISIDINGKIVFLFSGQGTQYLGMGKALYKNNKEFKQNVDYCIKFLQKEFNLDFKTILFDTKFNLLKQTQYAQLALFIIEYSLYKLWQKKDIVADYFIGHSVGEYVAACLADVFCLEDALKLLKVRGELMQSLENSGEMMVVFLGFKNLPSLPKTLDIAANNSPFQTVLSGNIAELKKYKEQLLKNKIEAQILNTKQAFHSKLMNPILDKFYSVAKTITYKKPKIPIISNISGKEATSDISCAKYWVNHIISTVQFTSSIEKVYENKARFFIEVGPGSVLINLAEQNLTEKDDKCYYFNSLINEDNSKQYLQKQIANLKLLKKDIFQSKDKEKNLLAPLKHNVKDRFKPFSLTPMQHAYWLGRNKQIVGGGVSIHMYLELDIQKFNKEHFVNAWKILIQRHEMLHAIIDINGKQKILEHIPEFTITEHSLKQNNEKQKEEYLQNVRQEMSHQNVSLEKWPQFELRISHFNNSSRVHISIDGWSIDGWSYQILFYELHQLYYNPKVKLPVINISFRDYVLRLKKIEHSKFYQKHLNNWIERLKTLPKSPQLPIKNTNGNRFKRLDYFISKEQYLTLKQYASNNSLTIVSTLLSSYAWVLSRYSKEHNITLNIPRFNRLPLHKDINRIIGEFASFTLLSCKRDRNTKFIEYANKIQKQLWEDVEKPWVSGVTLLRELGKINNHSNLTMPYVFTNMPEETIDGKKLEFLNQWNKSANIPYFLTQTPQVYIDCQYHDKEEGLYIFWDVLIDKFEPNIIDDLFSNYIELLKNLALSNKSWEQYSLQIQKSSSLISKKMEIPKTSIYEQFTNRVENYKENIAVYSENKAITYGQLYEKSQQLGTYLINNIDFDDKTPVIGIVMDKGWQQIVAVMGILASGAIFLPLDINLPKDRMNYALQNANVQLVITKNKQLSIVKEKLSDSIALISIDDKNIYKKINKKLPTKFEEILCIIYTSGSTGLPKGVMVTQKGLINSIVYTNNRFNINSFDTIFSLTPMHHDMALYDIFGALILGASIVIPEDKKRKDPHHWLDLINNYKVSIWNSVPTMMEMLLKFINKNQLENEQVLESLRLCFLGGDWISLTILPQLKKINKKTKLISVGGPTETTLWNIMYEVEEIDLKWCSIPYGKPIANTKYYILNNLLEECPVGVTGELYVSGVGLSIGYINDLEQTQKVFICHPKTKERMFKTGDLGKLLSSGVIEFMGRSDNQVQISGYRIELSELESLALKQKGIEKAQSLLIEEDTISYLALVYSCNEIDVQENKLKEQLKAFLPFEMIPKKLLKIKKFPLTANGKVDKNALKQLVIHKSCSSLNTQNILENEIQKSLMQLWQKYLKRNNINLDENFFEAGGNSLLATELFLAIREKYPIIDSVVLLYEHTSIYELSQFIEKQTISNKKINKRGLQRRKRLLAKK